jgi:hypothetical protein
LLSALKKIAHFGDRIGIFLFSFIFLAHPIYDAEPKLLPKSALDLVVRQSTTIRRIYTWGENVVSFSLQFFNTPIPNTFTAIFSRVKLLNLPVCVFFIYFYFPCWRSYVATNSTFGAIHAHCSGLAGYRLFRIYSLLTVAP